MSHLREKETASVPVVIKPRFPSFHPNPSNMERPDHNNGPFFFWGGGGGGVVFLGGGGGPIGLII